MRLRESYSWKIAFFVGVCILCFLNIMALLKSSSKNTREDIYVNEEIQSVPISTLVSENKTIDKAVSLSFEEKIENYKQQKRLKLLKTATNEKSPVQSRSVLEDADLLKSRNIKNPAWIDIHKMDIYFRVQDILALGKRRKEKKFAVFGIPTVPRQKAYYVLDTVKSLVKNLKDSEKHQVVIVVFIAGFSRTFKNKVINDIRSNFPTEVDSGIIQVLVPNPKFYPNFNKIPLLYGDSKERVHWRSKQCLDYAFLYYYCADIAEYYVQLEDDVISQPNYLSKMKSFINSKGDKWSVLEFGARGFIGMTYRTVHLKVLAKFVRFYFWTMPVDWLFRIFNNIWLFGNQNQNVLKPPLFLHVGAVSSLKGQKRKLEDMKNKHKKTPRDFQSKKGNPEAVITSTIKEHVDENDIYRPYSINGMFWGKDVEEQDAIEISLNEPKKLKKIIFASGSPEYPNDCFEETELFISTVTSNQCTGYKSVKTFNDKIVQYSLNHSTDPVKCIKLVINKVHHDSKGIKTWLLIPEIALLL